MGLGEGAQCSALGRLDEEGEGRDLVLEGVVRGAGGRGWAVVVGSWAP